MVLGGQRSSSGRAQASSGKVVDDTVAYRWSGDTFAKVVAN